ncbi:MAG: Rpn family recombination-promoting nuclease/putative transposase [Candidatus Eremiobacterota bacterium]
MGGLTLLNDIIFKIVFGSETSRPVLRALLNALLGLSGRERIADLDILNPHLDKDYVLDKGVILDVKARDGQGRLYNIEVQVASEPAYTERAVYYVTRLFSGQLEKGEPYSHLARTIGISLCDFLLFPDLQDLHSTYRLYDPEHGRTLTDILELHFIELSKFRRDKPHELRTPFEKWLHVLKFGELYEGDPGQVPEVLKQEEGIEMALEGMRRACASDEVRELVESRMKAMRDWASRLEHAHQEGREEGRAEGVQEGLQRGERKALLETARRMREAGIPAEVIATVTGLRPEALDS